jgi:Rieske 2Fe-2S family protein
MVGWDGAVVGGGGDPHGGGEACSAASAPVGCLHQGSDLGGVGVWRIVPESPNLICMSQYRTAGCGVRTKAVQRLNIAINNLVTEEDEGVVVRVRRGSANRGFEFGPLSSREVAVGWFAGRLRELLADTGLLGHDVSRT